MSGNGDWGHKDIIDEANTRTKIGYDTGLSSAKLKMLKAGTAFNDKAYRVYPNDDNNFTLIKGTATLSGLSPNNQKRNSTRGWGINSDWHSNSIIE